jgi:tetratricopeptide (TPR) repeat protein
MNVQWMFSKLVWLSLAWWRGRQVRLLLLGLPALAGAVCLAVIASACAMTPTQEVEAHYLVQAEQALKAKDYAKALTCYDRLAYRSAERPELRFGMAQAADALGQSDRAQLLMADLAPLDKPGYGPAHLWRARRLLAVPQPSAEARGAAEQHLRHALAGQVPDPSPVHALLGNLYLVDGELGPAEDHLSKAVKSRPELRLLTAQLFALRGDKLRARAEAEMALTFFRGRSKADIADHRARLGWADAATFLEQFGEAVAVLEEGYVVSREPIYPAAIAKVYATWYDTLKSDTKSSSVERLAMLEKGLKHDPSNQVLLERLLGMTQLPEPEAGSARAALQDMLANGKSPGMVHFALGVDALRQGNAEQARLHWERALELSPEMPALANNLAWMIASDKSPNLPRALSLVNLALQRAPDDLNFHHTRGGILFKMGRDKEALADLEAALPRFPENPQIHEQLAQIYDRLGEKAMAEEHRRQAEAKSAPKPASKANIPVP